MAKTKAFTKFIGPHGSDKSEGNLINQSSPSWILTFVRWNIRDTLRTTSPGNLDADIFGVRAPLVVENDCVQVSVSDSKGTLTPSMQCTLLETDVNYATAIAPGDFVFVNMVNWDQEARRIALIARDKNPGAINGLKDGFKGVFKVQGVRKVISVDPQSGTKMVAYKINGFAFTEFNNTIYYNPYLRTEDQGTGKDSLLFVSNIGADYKQLVSADHAPRCQDLIKALIQSFIGTGVSDRGVTSIGSIPVTTNTHFYIPGLVGQLLGIKSAKAAKDIYSYVFGLQKYSGSSKQDLAKGLNPSNLGSPQNGFYMTKTPVDGQTALKAEYWNQVKAWSIINQYVNQPVNELFTRFSVDPSGKVMPTVVLRQIPFTSEDFGNKAPFDEAAEVTRFLSLPRWKISSALITDLDLGRDEAARINFVQYYGTITIQKEGQNSVSAQTAARNFAYDINDVTRSGLRPYIVNSQFEDLSNNNDAKLSRKWALIIGDSVMGGHLKLNGSMTCVGIVDPIAIGDNLEYDGVVYHIEDISHVCSVAPSTGLKQFRTMLKLSNGVSVAGDASGLAYPEMSHTNAYNDRLDSYTNGNTTLPGVSEEQDVSYRPTNPAPTSGEVRRPDKPFAQPGQKIKPLKRNDEESNE